MKTKTILFALSALCLAVSCAKDSPKDDPKQEIYDGHFECRGVTYETLQAAVDACAASGEFAEITLIGNVKDDGAVIPDGIGDCFMLDLSAFRYVLNEGKCLNIGNNDAVLLAGGGGIEGNGVIIKSAGEDLSFSDNIIIKGDIVASSDICFEEDFLGKFEGSLSLDGGTAYFGSEHADIHIIDLTTKGSDASVQVYNAPKGGIRIDNVIFGTKYPVCAMKEGQVEIKSGAAPHVHNFIKSNETPADCCTHSHYTMICSDCGKQEVVYAEDEEEYGPCNPENLVHEAALPATATDLGYTERWVCPYCGKAYADKEGKTLLEDGGMLLPTSLLLDYGVRDSFSKIVDQQNFVDPVTLFGFILSFVSIFEGIPSLIPNTNWADLNGKINEMNRKLDELKLEMDTVIGLIHAQEAKKKINERYSQIYALSSLTISTFDEIARILSSSDARTEKQKIEDIKNAVKFWHNQDGGTNIGKFGPLSKQLLSQYPNSGLFGGKTIPEMYEIASNTVFLWEHDSYDFRKVLNAKDMVITCCAAVLELAYISDVETYDDPSLRKIAISDFKKYFEPYGNELKRDFDRMDSRKDKVRRLNSPFNVTFTSEIRWVDAHLWFSGNWKDRSRCRLPRASKLADVSIKTCNTVIRENMLDMQFTDEMARTIYNYYSRNGQQNLDFKKIMVDSAKFTPCARPAWGTSYDNSSSFFVTGTKARNFDHYDGDPALPFYNIFYWKASKWAGNDYLGLRTCLDEHANLEKKLVLPTCRINSGDSGHITKLGTTPNKSFYTLKRVYNDN